MDSCVPSVHWSPRAKILRVTGTARMQTRPLPAPARIAESFPAIQELAIYLKMPIWTCDLETTGIGKHTLVGLVEFASLQVAPDGVATTFSTLVNPELPIHWSASKVHGLYESHVRDAPTFPCLVAGLRKGFATTLVSGFNSKRYDVRVLQGNADRYGLLPLPAPFQLDVRDIWTKLHGQKGNLAVAAQAYEVTPGTAHRAPGDVLTTARLLEAILAKHGLDVLQPMLAKTNPNTHCALANL